MESVFLFWNKSVVRTIILILFWKKICNNLHGASSYSSLVQVFCGTNVIVAYAKNFFYKKLGPKTNENIAYLPTFLGLVTKMTQSAIKRPGN